MRRAAAILVVCAAAWLIGWFTQRSSPASFDFIAIYASARLVATGNAAAVTDREAIFAMERATLPERTIFANNANLPALSLVLAPIGALPFDVAYATMLTFSVAALAASAFLLAPLAAADQRLRLFPFALLAPPSTIALAQGQTSPFMLLVIAAALRAPPVASGALLGLLALRPQLLPLFGVIALADRQRRVPFLLAAAGVGLVSLLMVGPEGVIRYLDLLGPQAAELKPSELGVPALLRRAGLGAFAPAYANLALSAVAVVVAAAFILRAPVGRRMDRAAPATLLAAPHALLHDAILAYPPIAARARAARSTIIWVGTGLVAVLMHEAGIPIATLWLFALLLWPRSQDRREGDASERSAAPATDHDGSRS